MWSLRTVVVRQLAEKLPFKGSKDRKDARSSIALPEERLFSKSTCREVSPVCMRHAVAQIAVVGARLGSS